MSEESATHKNILAIKDHSVRTRKIVRDLEVKLCEYKNLNEDLNNKISLIQSQMQAMQIKLFSGGATSGN